MVIGPLELICGGNIQKFVTLYNRPCILYGIFNDPFSWEFEREECLETVSAQFLRFQNGTWTVRNIARSH